MKNADIFHLLGFNSTKSLKTLLCVFLEATRTLPQGCAIVSQLPLPCLCIPSLPGLATVRICHLELREGHGGWSLFPKRHLGLRKASVTQEPHRIPLSFRFHYMETDLTCQTFKVHKAGMFLFKADDLWVFVAFPGKVLLGYILH